MADKKIQGVQRIITYLQESVPQIPNVSKITRCGLKFTNRVAESLSRKGPGRCIFEPCDVREPDQIQAIIDKAVGIFGRLDCLFNNAGHNLPFRPFCETAVDEVTELLRTNFISQFVACQHALPHLRVTKGSIINMSSCTAQLGQKGNAVYAATKGRSVLLPSPWPWRRRRTVCGCRRCSPAARRRRCRSACTSRRAPRTTRERSSIRSRSSPRC